MVLTGIAPLPEMCTEVTCMSETDGQAEKFENNPQFLRD